MNILRSARNKSYRDRVAKKLEDSSTKNRTQWLRALAVPPWVDMMSLYALGMEARRLTLETGVLHTVDHVWPINGEGFVGLTVPWNLRIITFSENVIKGNARPDM